MENNINYTIKIYGMVQGVGFRPYVYKIAKELDIKGWVNNCDATVVIKAEGKKHRVEEFIRNIKEDPPTLSKIEKIEVIENGIQGYDKFFIKKSSISNTKLKFLLPDIATCSKCVKDILDKNSKRYRYAFTNCTLCGPRYSIIKALPYDRCNTTMKNFKMCDICKEEYKNPETRRFHAQPTCCSDCGPQLILTDNKGKKILCKDVIKLCAQFLKEGKIVAIKGIGGFHIVCNAFSETAVLEVRKMKERKEKPLAMMMKNINEVKKYCKVNKLEEKIITSDKRPIVLLRKRSERNISSYVAPNVKQYGVMLPYNPIHYLLFQEDLPPLVMTSGNISGNPIEYTNQGALKNLSNIVHFFLLNNRDINTPVDDSVVKILENKVMVSRLGRGLAPYYIKAKVNSNIFSCGAQEKSTFSFSLDGIVYTSQYLGNLQELRSYREYLKCIKNIKYIFGFSEDTVAFDMHPGYMSTIYGKGLHCRKVAIQHHHAHMASCMLEHDIWENVIGVIYDGTGYGLDGNIWGGEFFIGNRREFNRIGHFKYTEIQGGDSAEKEIWKIGVSYIKNIKKKSIMDFGLEKISCALIDDKEIRYKNIKEEFIKNVCTALECHLNCYNTSSVGRLFDAVCSIVGLRERISYDAQGAIELENIIDEDVNEAYIYEIEKIDEVYIVDYCPTLIEILEDVKKGINISKISAKFHNTLVNITVDMVSVLRKKFKINKVVLGGGVFENLYLLKNICKCLKKQGFEVFFNEDIPINDSGISLGQVTIASEIISNK